MRTNFDVLVFDIVGKIAHFRKFYSNSSSLTYLFPPRTTLEGIVAAILGFDRDSYYDLFDPSECMITVSPRTKLRTIMQTINYLYVKSLRDLNGKQSRTQVPFELIVPEDFRESLRYRVYIAHSNDQVISKLESYLREGKSRYPISLGPANFIAKAFYVSKVHNASLSKTDDKSPIKIQTPILASKTLVRSLPLKENRTSSFSIDVFPFHFGSGRKLGANRRLIYDKNFKPITLFNKGTPFVEVKYQEGASQVTENILFLEALSED